MKFIEIANGVMVNFEHVEEIQSSTDQDWVEIIMRDKVISVVFGHEWRESKVDPVDEAASYAVALYDAMKSGQPVVSFLELQGMVGQEFDYMVEWEKR